jgi:hypothetical protein
MLVSFLIRLITAQKEYAASSKIRGNLSQGRKDKPGVWYK